MATELVSGSESASHLRLKSMAVNWALAQGLSFVSPEVSFPHRRFRVDVAACLPVRKVPHRKAVHHITSILKETIIFECKQVRSDLIRDNYRQSTVSKRLETLESRKRRLEVLLQLHLPHLAQGESLFPEFDSYRLREHNHVGYQSLLKQIRRVKNAILTGTKFDRLFNYRMANLHYLVTEENIIEPHELPYGWGLLTRRDDRLEMMMQPLRQVIGVEEQLIFLQRIAARKSLPLPL